MPLYKTVSLNDIPPISRLQELEHRRTQFPTTYQEYGWFYEKKNMMWQFYPWTQLPNIATSPSYYRAVYDKVLTKDGKESGSTQNLSTPANWDSHAMHHGGSHTERAPAKPHDSYDRSMDTYRSQYRPAISDGQKATYLKDIKTVELTTRDDKKLRFDLCDHSNPPATSRF